MTAVLYVDGEVVDRTQSTESFSFQVTNLDTDGGSDSPSDGGTPDLVLRGEGSDPTVVDVVEREDGRAFRTKGDANEAADERLASADHVLGRAAFAIPFVGHVVAFGSTDAGVLLLVIVPAALLGLSEAYDLLVAARRGGE